MSKNDSPLMEQEFRLLPCKSKFEFEFRRFSWQRSVPTAFEAFYILLEKLHNLSDLMFVITYTSFEGDQLPINNDDNLAFALTTSRSILRLTLKRKGESILELTGYGTCYRRNNDSSNLCKLLTTNCHNSSTATCQSLVVGLPQNFVHVSSVVDVDIVPSTQRRVKLMKAPDDKRPLGFFIRDGYSMHVTADGVEHCPGVFISRLVAGGLAASTGLLAVNDEILEVNGIDVSGKTLDQVTDMMIANSLNLIVTICPFDQRNNVCVKSRNHRQRVPTAPRLENVAYHCEEKIDCFDEIDSDEVRDHTPTLPVRNISRESDPQSVVAVLSSAAAVAKTVSLDKSPPSSVYFYDSWDQRILQT